MDLEPELLLLDSRFSIPPTCFIYSREINNFKRPFYPFSRIVLVIFTKVTWALWRFAFMKTLTEREGEESLIKETRTLEIKPSNYNLNRYSNNTRKLILSGNGRRKRKVSWRESERNRRLISFCSQSALLWGKLVM